MMFITKTYTDPSAYLNDLEQRIADAMPRTVRVPVPAIAAPSGTVGLDVPVTWPKAFPDTNYTVQAMIEDNGTQAVPYGANVRDIRARTATGCTIRVNSSTAVAAGQAFIHVLAVAD